ncbi:MAG: MarC family protein [Elstera sp.]|uniref:MarC family protein n=1 Tax=Elstera sp. TaxID=1916664 RepID=UPI0037C0220E
MGELSDYVRFLVSLFAILTPFAALPTFLTLTQGETPEQQRLTALTAARTVAGVLIAASLSGDAVLSVLGASIHSFRVGGGLVLVLMSLSMLSAKVSSVQQSAEEAVAVEDRTSSGVVPLGIPLLAGPGAISSVIVEGHRIASLWHQVGVIACIIVVAAALYWSLRLAVPIGEKLGRFGLNIINRLFGLLLAAIGVEMMAGGLRALFSGLN